MMTRCEELTVVQIPLQRLSLRKMQDLATRRFNSWRLCEMRPKNEGGAAGAGIGICAGIGMGQMVAGMVGSFGNTQAQPAAPSENDPLVRMGKLKQMLGAGLISQSEFGKKKKQMRGGI